MLAEPQRICFERAERPSVVKGDRGEANVLGRKMSQPIKNVKTDLKIGQTVLPASENNYCPRKTRRAQKFFHTDFKDYKEGYAASRLHGELPASERLNAS